MQYPWHAWARASADTSNVTTATPMAMPSARARRGGPGNHPHLLLKWSQYYSIVPHHVSILTFHGLSVHRDCQITHICSLRFFRWTRVTWPVASAAVRMFMDLSRRASRAYGGGECRSLGAGCVREPRSKRPDAFGGRTGPSSEVSAAGGVRVRPERPPGRCAGRSSARNLLDRPERERYLLESARPQV